MNSPKKRVVAYVDGFNMYHAIENHLPEHFKWLDYRKLVQSLLGPDEALKQVILFTAYPEWDSTKLARHKNYLKVLAKTCWVDIILGKFKKKSVKFNASKHPIMDGQRNITPGIRVIPPRFIFQTYEEKETDVNIALHILKGAFRDEYDVAYIFSADSDISPAVTMCRKLFPLKEYCFIFPYESFSKTNYSVANMVKSIWVANMEFSLLPITVQAGTETITSPYKNPPEDG